MVPSAAGMLLVMQRLLLLMHQSSLQTSCEWEHKHVDDTKKGFYWFYPRIVVKTQNCSSSFTTFSFTALPYTHGVTFYCLHMLWQHSIYNNVSIKQLAVPDVHSETGLVKFDQAIKRMLFCESTGRCYRLKRDTRKSCVDSSETDRIWIGQNRQVSVLWFCEEGGF